MTQKQVDKLTYRILGAAIYIHRLLGPGLLESVYTKFLAHELIRRGLTITTEKNIQISSKGIEINSALRYDMLVNDFVVVEVKAVDKLLPIHIAQILTYMKFLRKPKGILVNFNCTNIFKYGQKTLVNEHYRNLPTS